jgi:UDP-N-acetylglucosamine 1-carboxyvinyltransferase
MEKFIVKGGRKLSGKVSASVSKNAVLPIMCACLLTKEGVLIKNCPKIKDVYSMIEIFNYLGVKTEFLDDGLYVNSSSINGYIVPKELTNKLRASSLLIGALSSRLGKAVLSYPGGCNIGERPLDLHIKILKKLGITIKENQTEIIAENNNKTSGEVRLDYPSVGATENAILCSVLGNGKTTIRNCAKEPEIKDLCDFLNYLGAKIRLDNSGIIYIESVKSLLGGEYLPIFDRIETGTLLIASALTGGDIEISGIKTENIFSLLTKLCESTCKITINNDIIYIKSGTVKKPFVVKTGPFPLFPTDLQAQISVLASVSSGVSVIEETVFPNRFTHVQELLKMGAKVSVKNNVAYFRGVSSLNGANVYASDLRGGASLVLAGLVANGETVVHDVYHIDRGYEKFDEKIRSLGGDVFRR